MRLKMMDDGKYVLEAMSGQTISLTVTEVVALAQILDRFQDQIKPMPSPGAPKPIATTRISKGVVGLDVHHTEVIVRLQDRGFEQAYAMAPDVAADMRDGLSVKLEEIRFAQGRRTKQ